MTLKDYIAVQQKNLDAALKFELFGACCPLMDELYQLSIAAVPSDKSPVYGQFLLICHKSFLAAATLIGQAQPDDAGPITRRAIEVVRLAAAVKDDPSIAEKWIAYEERMARWGARDRGEKPKRFHVDLPVKHPLVKELMEMWGVMSDGDVHFAPEYLHSLQWKKSEREMRLEYFTGDQRTIETTLVTLFGVHMMMLRVLDDCLDGSFSSVEAWHTTRDQLNARAKPWVERLRQPEASDESVGE
ncbi:MAG: hypothetical protein RLO08_14285 [Parvibaculaceae bacterium]